MSKVETYADVTAVILAGGLATRLGGVDKGLQPLDDKPLIEHVLNCIRPQAGTILINCNRNTEIYAAYGHAVIPDLLPDFPGPLAGLHAALKYAQTDLVATVPCDTPYLPFDLIERLRAHLWSGSAAYACTPEQQPVFALYRRSVLPELEQFLASGKRGVGQWLSHIDAHKTDFSDCSTAFRNLNSADDWPGC